MAEFEGVAPALNHALTKRGYEKLTPVQVAICEPQMQNADLLVSSQTGSGKTVAFGIAVAETLLDGATKFSRSRSPLCLVIAPTRELALQVKRELEWLYEETGAIIASCVGGMDIRTERRTLERGAHIVVGTPGRLRDHIMRKSLDLSLMRAVVLDEADEMLDLGFKEDLEFMLEEMPQERRTLLFSATVPPMIAKLAKQYQTDAVRVSTSEEAKQHVDIEYRALMVAPRERDHAIVNVLRYYEAQNALVFCNTRATVNHMVSRFNNRGFSVVALSGELSQSERTHALQAMRDGRARVCIATDVAARGIDLPNLELVVHAELPSNPETLLHRSGRTGRAGRKGVSALIVDAKNRKKAERLLRFAKINATWASPPTADEVNRRDEDRMLEHPSLTEPVREEEKEFLARLLKNYSSEQLAAAFVRANRMGKSAPEDIQQVPVHAPEKTKFKDRLEREPRAREEFENSQWISLSVGRKQNAEPRWLIPLLCNAGEISKRDIGMIKMQPNETFVQLEAGQADGFFDALGPNGVLEKNIRVKKLDGTPSFSAGPSGKGPKKPHRGAKPDFKKPKRKFDEKRSDESRAEVVDDRKKRSKPADAPKKAGWAKKKSSGEGKTKRNVAATEKKVKPGKPKNKHN